MDRFIICARTRVKHQFGVSGKLRSEIIIELGEIMVVLSYTLIRITSRATYILC